MEDQTYFRKLSYLTANHSVIPFTPQYRGLTRNSTKQSSRLLVEQISSLCGEVQKVGFCFVLFLTQCLQVCEKREHLFNLSLCDDLVSCAWHIVLVLIHIETFWAFCNSRVHCRQEVIFVFLEESFKNKLHDW